MSLPQEILLYGKVINKISTSLQPAVKYLQHVESQPDKKWSPDERLVNLKEELVAYLITQRELQTVIPPTSIIEDHRQIISAYKDIIDGTEHMLDSFNIEEKKLSSHQYDFGYHIQKSGIAKIMSSVNGIMNKLNDSNH